VAREEELAREASGIARFVGLRGAGPRVAASLPYEELRLLEGGGGAGGTAALALDERCRG
jgi:ABC-type branched-subunit amino acid transport system ATPase component